MIIKPIGRINLDHVTDENRDEIFQQTVEHLKTRLSELHGKKRKKVRGPTHKFLCSFDKDGYLSQTEEQVEIDSSGQTLSPSEFWWPSSFNEAEYEIVDCYWFNPTRSRNRGHGRRLGRSAANAELSIDSKSFVESEVQRIDQKIDNLPVFDDGEIDYDSIECKAYSHLSNARKLLVKSGLSPHQECNLWKALERAYLAGRRTMEMDTPETRKKAKHAQSLGGGSVKKKPTDLVAWEMKVKGLLSKNPEAKWRDVLADLKACDLVVTLPDYRIYLAGEKKKKGIKEGSFENKFKRLKERL